MNLLEETYRALEQHDKAPSGVQWVGSFDGSISCSWGEFEKLASLYTYDPGREPQVAQDLVVVGGGGDWWFSRVHQHGQEWWTFNKIPERSPRSMVLTRVDVRWLAHGHGQAAEGATEHHPPFFPGINPSDVIRRGGPDSAGCLNCGWLGHADDLADHVCGKKI